MASSTKDAECSAAAPQLASRLNGTDLPNSTGQAGSSNPRASGADEKLAPNRRHMIDGIAVSPQVLQALRRMQRSSPTALSSAGRGGPASGFLPVSPSQQLQPAARNVAPGVARIATHNSPDLSAAASAEPQGASSSSRSSKRPRPSDEPRPTSAQPDLVADGPESPVAPEGDEVSVSGGDHDNGALMDSDSEDDNANMEQPKSLQRMVEQLTELARENSTRIQGFSQNIDELMRSRGVLSARVDSLHLQLHHQQVQITDLQQQLYQMQMRVAADAQPLQRSASSSSHFEL